MDSNDLERERGITILSKNTAVRWRDWRINIVDTPGHADFGGEVERVLSMVDSVLLLVDAVEGPMPQTRFVTQKAFARGFKPVLVINKMDRDNARPDWVLDQTFDLFDRLGATDEQLDFPVIYASALAGYAGTGPEVRDGDMTALFEAVVSHVPSPEVDADGPLQLQVSSLDYSPYVGVLGIGRINRGRASANTAVSIVGADGTIRIGRLMELYGFDGLERHRIEDGQLCEPWESLTVDFQADYQGAVMSRLAERKGELLSMQPDGRGRIRLDYRIPARGLIGFRTEYLTETAGTGLMYHVFDKYDRRVPDDIGQRNNGVMVSIANGKSLAYALFNLQNRGRLFVGHGEAVYEGMIVGIHSRGNDLGVNPTKAKQLTNIRAAGSDENILLTPPVRLSLEQALEFIDADELVEVTPASIRLRKKLLTEVERRRESRQRA
jgi:small GTP-binding protein